MDETFISYRMILKRIALIIFVVVIFLSASGQERIIFRTLSTRDGLSNGSIKSILQDNDGFMWFGTIGGLNKYDGVRFVVFNNLKNNPQSLSSDDVTSIFQDSKKRMWIGTFGGGLNLFDKATNKFKSFQVEDSIKKSISSTEINFIYEDSRNQIWVGTENGLNKYIEEDNSFKSYILSSENPFSISSNSVRAIYEDTLGIFWVGTFGGGLNKFDSRTEKFTHYKLDPRNVFSLSSDFILDIEPLKNKLLIGTNGGGLELFDPGNGRFTNFFNDYSKDFKNIQIIKDIYTDSQGIIWIATDGEGLFKITEVVVNGQSFYSISRFLYSNKIKSSVASNAIYKIYEDHQHNIWIGTAWSGISIIEHSQGNIEFYYSDIEGIDPLAVISVYADPTDNLWIGSDGKGLYCYNKKTGGIANYSNISSSSSDRDYIQVIKEDIKGNLWIGTYSNGLGYFDTKTRKFKTYRNNPSDPKSISHNNVRSIVSDGTEDLWVTTWGGGLSHYVASKGEFTNYLHNENDPKSLSNNNALALEEAGNGKFWVGTFGGGLNLFDPQNGSFTKFFHQKDNPNSLSGNNILCLHKDQNENLWIGTWGAGLTKFDIIRQIFTRYDLENGLINNTVTAIEEDNEGILWLSTKKGICSLNPTTNEIKLLNLNRNSRVNEFHINSSYKDRNGKLYFGGIEGLICFNPDKLANINSPLVVKLTGFEIFNKEVEINDRSILKKQITYSDEIRLNYKQSVFTIRYAALDFPFSDNCQYAVKMEGFENDWREMGTQNSATYTNLSPGKYTFMIKAKPFNSEWNNEFTKITIIITPPIFKTWWAITGYILVFIGLLYAFQRYTLIWARLKNNLKVERLKREQESNIHQLKIRFFTNISHEIRTPLMLVHEPLNDLIESGQGGINVQRPLKIIKKNADRLMQLINELLDFRRIELGKLNLHIAEGNIVKFTHEIFLSFREYARNHIINYDFQTSSEKIQVWYDRIQMEKVIYNLLSNAFKYTPEHGNISVEIKIAPSEVQIIVKDSGEGISEDKLPHVFERFYQTDDASLTHQAGFGIGLSIVKELVDLHAGNINVISENGKGSVFTITLKLGKDHFAEEAIAKDFKNSENIENYEPITGTEYQNSNEDYKELNSPDQTILVVEDNNDLRSYLIDKMSTEFNIIEAKDGKEGIEKAVENIPDFVISDVMMPVMDGIELCHRLKTDIRTSHIPIILLTARTASIYKMEGYETGADDYLTKPFRLDELKIRIKNILNNRKILRERYLKEALMQPRELLITSPDEKFLFNLIEVIEKNIDQSDFKVDLLSRELNMSHSVIYKKLKALSGQSLVEFVRDIRLKRAAQLLAQNKLSITEICYQVGFTDRRYFSQIFKKKYGKTPTDYANDKAE
jgi:signal transduction histidine kinase/ligand-binding sensor domain-containing protein/DNA-binding response OmpR family regulator